MQQKIFIGLALTLVIVIFIPLYWATEAGRQEAARERLQAAEIEKGAQLYMANCATCHGAEGEGNIGPPLIGSPLDEEAMEKIISRGMPGTAMAAWGQEDGGPLKDFEVRDLVTFIKNWDSTLLVAEVETQVERVTPTAPTSPAQPPVPPSPTPIATEQGQAIFEQKCKSCHSIGGGRLVGPDLKGITEKRDRDWLVRFILSPDRLLAEGDPLAKQLAEEYGIPMPNMGLSQDEAEEVLAYIEEQSGGEPGPPPAVSAPPPQPSPPPSETEAPEVTPAPAPLPTGDAASGRDIFLGRARLENGGASCISCHNINGIGAFNGGSVGRDLSGVYSALGEQGLTSVLKTTPFPIMQEIYRQQPLTDEEIAHLVAFLREAAIEEKPPSRGPGLFIIISIAGSLAVLGIFQLAWRGRLSGVRQRLLRGGSK